ncbi:MAG TPA: rubrerythrin family protein [Saprospiraceae bacterium]|nr:rubrerythrin family protein [Saprospiraceae bacterium]
MKKNILMLAFLAFAAWILLPACGSKTNDNTGLQAPETTQAEVPASAANTEKADDDDDDKGKDKKTGLNVAADAQTATVNNLITAYTGETTASAKYAAYAKKAQEEGYTQIALLFKATSASEKIHANNHRSVLEDMGQTVPDVKPQYTVKTTKENLTDAITGESYEITTMYPEFLAAANAADNQLALTSLNYAYRTEQRHKPLYEKALAALQNNEMKSLAAEYYVCPTCGNTYDSVPPKRCRISMTNSERFVKINAL